MCTRWHQPTVWGGEWVWPPIPSWRLLVSARVFLQKKFEVLWCIHPLRCVATANTFSILLLPHTASAGWLVALRLQGCLGVCLHACLLLCYDLTRWSCCCPCSLCDIACERGRERGGEGVAVLHHLQYDGRVERMFLESVCVKKLAEAVFVICFCCCGHRCCVLL